MRSFLLLFAWLFVALSPALSQAILQPVSARYLGLGAYSSSNVDIYATRSNAASLAELKQGAAAVYGERRFMLEDLNLYTASVGIPTKSGTFALHGSYFGFDLSNQTQLSLGYGIKINKKINVGAAFHYNQISQAGIYGSASAITGSIGILMHLTDKIHAGFNAYNPISVAYNKSSGDEERLASQYSFGFGFDASEKLYLSTELIKDEGHNLNVNAGFQYQFVKQFFIRGGIATATTNYFMGLGFRLKDFRLDVSSSYHPQLGWSPGLMLMYHFGKIREDSPEQAAAH